MRISDLLKTKYKTNIKGLKTNSKEITNGDVFICALGNIDKTIYIDDAIKRGCSFIIANKKLDTNKPYIVARNVSKTLKIMLDKYYNYPLSKIKLIGITGTDGKTTTSTILKKMTDGACIGTNGYVRDNNTIPLNNTTPSLDKVYECLDDAIKNNVANVFMEVSSECYLTNRLPYLPFNIGVFTNITKEHLDKHKSFANYFNCKMQLLRNSDIVVINRDSKYFHKIKHINPHYCTYGMKKSDLQIKRYCTFIDHTIIEFIYQKKKYIVNSPLIGKFNVYNLAASFLVLLILGYKIDEIVKMTSKINVIPGRDEVFYHQGYHILLDHAHTINATKNVLKFAKKHNNGRIITVVGCAGERYKEKRRIIGTIVSRYSNIVILTRDDPRKENPQDIIDDMLKDVRYHKKKIHRIIDRKIAIIKALSLAQKGDLVLILGRGRDRIMHLNGCDIIHSDYDVIMNYINKKTQII